MRLISVNDGLPSDVSAGEEVVRTAIFKTPVDGSVIVRTLNLDGDRQADLTVHGGPAKAVYGYPSEHYEYWREELPDAELPLGVFGENLTTEGVDERTLHIGDRLRIGSAELVVTQPRLPCYKLALRFGRADMIKRFMSSGRSGFYFAVATEGALSAGDAIEVVHRDPAGVSVADIVHLYVTKHPDRELLRRASTIEALPQSWRERFAQRARA